MKFYVFCKPSSPLLLVLDVKLRWDEQRQGWGQDSGSWMFSLLSCIRLLSFFPGDSVTGRVLGRCGFSSDSWSRGGCPDLRTSERQPRLTTRGAPGNRHPTPGVLEPPSVGEVAGGRAGGAAFLLFLASWSGDGLVLREDPPRSQLPLQEGREVVPGGNGDQHRGGLGPHHSAQRAITRGFSLIRSHSALTCAPFSPGSVLTQSTRLSRSRLVSSGAEDPPTKEASLWLWCCLP